jgi:hypothetical protein
LHKTYPMPPMRSPQSRFHGVFVQRTAEDMPQTTRLWSIRLSNFHHMILSVVVGCGRVVGPKFLRYPRLSKLGVRFRSIQRSNLGYLSPLPSTHTLPPWTRCALKGDTQQRLRLGPGNVESTEMNQNAALWRRRKRQKEACRKSLCLV